MMTLYCDESDGGQTYALAGWLAVPSACQTWARSKRRSPGRRCPRDTIEAVVRLAVALQRSTAADNVRARVAVRHARSSPRYSRFAAEPL